MNAKKKICPNCHLPVEDKLTVCPFCGEEIKVEINDNAEAVEETGKSTSKKIKLPLYHIFYLVALGLGLLIFALMALPAESVLFYPIYFWAFASEQTMINGTTYIVGGNAATIVFVFAIVSTLNQVAVLRSVRRKTTEIALFSYFSAFTFAVTSVVAFLGTVLMSYKSSGTPATQFGFGIGFLVIGVVALAATALNVFGVIKFKQATNSKN